MSKVGAFKEGGVWERWFVAFKAVATKDASVMRSTGRSTSEGNPHLHSKWNTQLSGAGESERLHC